MRIALTTCFFYVLATAAVLSGMTACAQAPPPADPPLIRETGQGQIDFASDQIGELSGITYLGPDSFAVISDKGGRLGMATIKIDQKTGAILSASIDQIIKLEGGRDLEDLAIDPSTCQLLTVDEAAQSIALHHFPSGKRTETVDVPGVFKQARPNLGFESISSSPYSLSIWAANEEPLKADGRRATEEAGGLIRLQQFNHEYHPAGQYAYRVDPHRGNDNVLKRAQSGVVGLVTLPSGRLLVMERELGGQTTPTFRTRLYLIDTEEATDTTEVDALTEEGVTPVRKQLLFESNTGLANFEGITLGPKLDNGDYTLILVSDDGGGKLNPQNLLSLRIAAGLVEPALQDTKAHHPE